MVKIANFLPQKRELVTVEDTWVLIKPPSYRTAILRAAIAGQGRSITVTANKVTNNAEANVARLFASEIWLTYQDTNLEVEIPQKWDENGEVTEWKKIVFEPREDETVRSFTDKVEDLPLHIVYDWHDQVCVIVPEWRIPF